MMDTPTARAQAYWQDAKKHRSKIIRDIEQLKKGTSGKSEEEQLRKLEEGIAQFRLRFVFTIQQDPQYAFQEDAEDVMWKLHIFVNIAYRTLLNDSLRGQQHVVTRRKVEKLYINYLNTAHAFYKSYFQRLQSLHGMPQIPRINSMLQLEACEVDEVQSALVPAEAVQKSFYTTLLHLGDLARWRHKARPKSEGLKTALLYYDIAHDLKPTSGAAHHQMGIIFTEENNHLLVVYHLYRSLAIEHPHGNSTQNLEMEFRKLLQTTTPGRRSGPPDPNEAFSNWFIRLHARFYKGEQFPGQVELEEEVLHRLEIMLKKPDALSLILKMVLINMAAYYVAKSRVEKEWSLGASASCQYILRLNIRWILVLSRLLYSELHEFVKAAPPGEQDVAQNNEKGSKTKDAVKFSAFTENILPLMRMYMTWLYIHRTDVVDYQEHLGPYVFDMYRTLAQSLSLVAKEFSGEQMSASPYLLEEDVVALGMKPFADPDLPPVCRIHYLPGKNIFKPHWEDNGLAKNTAEEEMRGRVFELMHVGFSLAFDERFPLGIKTPADGSSDAIAISYIEGGKVPAPVQEPIIISQPTQLEVTQEDAPHDQTEQENIDVKQLEGQFRNLQPSQDESLTQNTSCDNNVGANVTPVVGSNGRGHARVPSSSETYHTTRPYQPTPHDLLETESDLSLYAQMHSMVADLVDEDNSNLNMETTRQEGPSYGMHPTTADQVFGNIQTQRNSFSDTLGNTVAPAWDPFMDQSRPGTHAKSANTTPQIGTTAGLHISSPRNISAAMGVSTLQPNVPAFTPNVRPQTGSDLQSFFPAGNTTPLGNPFGQTGLGFGRPSSGLSGTLRGGSGFSHARQRLGGSTDSSATSSFLSPKGTTSAYQIVAGTQNVGDRKSMSPPLGPPLGLGLSSHSFSTVFSQTSSGLPPVNSPYGLLGAQLDGATGQRETFPYYQAFPAQLDNSALYKQPNNLSTVCNGNVYDATTAFGRGDVSTKDDPTHFRNAVRKTNMAAAVAEADAYDRAILERALADDNRQPKR